MAGRPSAARSWFRSTARSAVAADVRRLTLKTTIQNPKEKGPSHFGCCKLRRRLPVPHGPAYAPWTQPQSLPRGEPAFRGSWPVPLLGGARGGFHVILHFIPARRQ